MRLNHVHHSILKQYHLSLCYARILHYLLYVHQYGWVIQDLISYVIHGSTSNNNVSHPYLIYALNKVAKLTWIEIDIITLQVH